MSVKLFYKNPYLTEFSGTIIDKKKQDKGWKIRLDQTAFYPEGGGQPADTGFLNGITVFDVQKEDGEIYHFVDNLPEGDNISGSIDWDHRFDYMQQHTGQHILSAVLKRVLQANTVAVHEAEDYTSIEIDLNDVSDDDIKLVEDQANGLICSNQPIFSYLNGQIPIENFPIRRETKFTEDVRLVQIGGESLENGSADKLKEAGAILKEDLVVEAPGLKDLSACAGVHTGRTGEVGLIKFKSREKVRGRVRLFWLIGGRAFNDYRIKTELTDKIGDSLSVPVNGIEEEFERLVSSIGDLKKRNSELLREMAFLKAQEIKNEIANGVNTFHFENIDTGYFKQIIISLSAFPGVNICLMNQMGKEGQWALISTGDPLVDFNYFRQELLPMVQGKGGGKAPLWQGKLGDCTALNDFRDKFSQSLT